MAKASVGAFAGAHKSGHGKTGHKSDDRNATLAVVGTLTIDTSSGQKVYSNRTGYFEPYVP
jgi:hypothetical protein